jgi:uncharacterized membrane-anchored protein
MLTESGLLPPLDPLRVLLHNEIHARPQARIRLPALVVYVAVTNEGVSREEECAHLRQLPGQQDLQIDQLSDNFLRLRFDSYTLKWERHTEFTRYSLVQTLPEHALLGAQEPELLSSLVLPSQWLRDIPGKTIAAIKLAMLQGDVNDTPGTMALARTWLGDHQTQASRLGNFGDGIALSDFAIRPCGFERMLVVFSQASTPTRVGRVSQRLLEMETYRLMALRGLPAAKALAPMLAQAERSLADITAQLENKSVSDQALLDTLIALAARVERAMAENTYRFAATRAYDSLVHQRIAELRETAVPGMQAIGEFLQRRLSPAMATVAACAQRLESLSERIARTSAMLRTRVDIAAEVHNQQLLEKLTRGQEMQLRLQTTVEGLSIAAISYYVISLLLYAGKALKGAGLAINPEVAAGALILPVLWVVWKATRRIHNRLIGER